MEYKAYSFDLDDNLLKLPTLIYLEDENGEEKEFTTHEYEKMRSSLEELKLKITENSFRSFREDKQFLTDIEKSTKAGSWRNLVNCITKHASIFAIITAREHSPDTIREGLRRMIIKHISKEELDKFVTKFSEKYGIQAEGKTQEEILDIYLDLCKFYPVNNPKLREMFESTDVSELKSRAFEDFQSYIKEYVAEKFGKDTFVKIGFSDDSVLHLNRMINNILKKHGLFFYHTSDEGKSDFI